MKTKALKKLFSAKIVFHLAKETLELHVFINGKHLYLQQSYPEQQHRYTLKQFSPAEVEWGRASHVWLIM